MRIYRNRLLRRFLLPLLKATSFDFCAKHHWVENVQFRLNSFRHKGYWYHGRNREEATMELFRRIICPGDIVVEVGGHIGYISLYFADLVGPSGKVFVFEPGKNNLPYIRTNLKGCMSTGHGQRLNLIESAVGDKNGVVTFFEESLTGQNNSIVRDFDGLRANKTLAFVTTEVVARQVSMVSLDDHIECPRIDFIKIDIEGFEWFALLGAKRILEDLQPAIMVEIQANRKEIFAALSRVGYVLFTPGRKVITSADELKGNTFCLSRKRHFRLIQQLGLD